jgi:hypothetical protein
VVLKRVQTCPSIWFLGVQPMAETEQRRTQNRGGLFYLEEKLFSSPRSI